MRARHAFNEARRDIARDAEIIRRAKELYHVGGEVEIDEEAVIVDSDGGGWVRAWVFAADDKNTAQGQLSKLIKMVNTLAQNCSHWDSLTIAIAAQQIRHEVESLAATMRGGK